MKIDKCPECGEPIEASVKVYLDDVVVEDGKIVSFTDSSALALGVELTLYCASDHEGAISDAVEDWPNAITLNGVRYGT